MNPALYKSVCNILITVPAPMPVWPGPVMLAPPYVFALPDVPSGAIVAAGLLLPVFAEHHMRVPARIAHPAAVHRQRQC